MLLLDAARPATNARLRVAATSALLALTLSAFILILLSPGGPARPLAVFLTAIFLPGAAVLTRLDVRDPFAALGLTVAISVALVGLCSTAMVWIGWFHPYVVAAIVAATAVAVLVMDLASRLNEVPGAPLLRTYTSGDRRTVVGLATLVPLVLAVGAWALSLSNIDLYHLDDYGLPPELPYAWYAALGVCVIGGALAASLRAPGWVIGLYVLGAIVVLFATLPLLAEQPHYTWSYKHIGVVRLLEATGQVDPGIDIYNRWPTFFAFMASFSVVGGPGALDPTHYAAWSELFFTVMTGALLGASARAITGSALTAGLAALVFVLANWVGQTYFSPQAFAFMLTLAVDWVVITQLASSPNRLGRRVALIAGKAVRRPAAVLGTDPLPAPTWTRAQAVGVIALLVAAIVSAHQLTPYLLVAQLLVLTVVGVVRPPWLVALVAALTALYLVPNYNWVAHNFGLFTSFDPFNNSKHETIYNETPLAGKHFNARAGQLLGLLVWAAAALSAVRLARREIGTRLLLLVGLGFAPFAVVFGQSYGGEAVLRVVLFSSPWCAVLIAWALSTIELRPIRVALTAGLVAVLAGLFVPTYFGQEELNSMPASEVRTSQYIYANGTKGSVIMLSGPGFPLRVGARYGDFRGPISDEDPNLLRGQTFRDRPLGPPDVPDVIATMLQYSKRGYLVFSATQDEYARVFQLTPPGALRSLEQAVRSSSRFRLWHEDGTTRVYELVGGGAA